MIFRNTALSTTIILMLLGSIVVLNFGSFSQALPSTGDQVGRYSIAVDGENAYLIDTATGCVWRRTSQIPFTLMSVEGILEVPPHPKEKEDAVRQFPEKCR